MSFHALNKTVTSVPMYFGGNAPVGKLLDLVAQEQRGLAIDTVSGKILIRDRDNPSIDRLVDINPTRNEDRIFNYSGSPKTIMDKNGKLRKTSINMLPNSNDLTGFTATNTTIALDGALNPNGSVVTFVSDTATTNRHIAFASMNSVSGITYLYRLKVKAAGKNYAHISMLGGGSSSAIYGCVVDLTDGSIFNDAGMTRDTPEGITATSVDLGDGQYEVIITMTTTDATLYAACGPSDVAEPSSFAYYAPNYAGVLGEGVYVWDAQVAPLDQSEIFVPCTQANQLEIPLNHKYNSVTDTYEPLGILIEPQRTNLMLHNKSTVSWAERTEDGPHATLRYVQTNAADFKGRMIAKKLVPSTSSALQRIYKVVGNINSGATEKLCYQCFFKAGGYSKVRLQNSENEGVTIDLLDGSNTPFGNTVTSGNGYGSENQGDGWWFAWVVFDHPNTDTGDVPWIQILDDTGASTFAGNGTDGIYFYGDQLTVGDHPTSLIETDSSTVTRLADDLSLALPFWNNDGMTVIAEFEYYGDPVGTTYGRAGGLVFAVTKTGESVFLNQWVVGRYIGDVYGISRSDQTGTAASAAVATVNDVMLGNGPFKMAFSFDNTEQQLALNGGAFVSTTNNNVVLQDATTLNLSHAYNGAVGQKRLKSLIVVPRTWTQTEMLQGSQL